MKENPTVCQRSTPTMAPSAVLEFSKTFRLWIPSLPR